MKSVQKQKKLKDIPEFKTEDEERAFWATHSDLDFPGQFRVIKGASFPNLKRTKNLSLTKKKPENKGKAITQSPRQA